MAFHTFLVDKNDSIRVIGSPVLNEKIKDLYKQETNMIIDNLGNNCHESYMQQKRKKINA